MTTHLSPSSDHLAAGSEDVPPPDSDHLASDSEDQPPDADQGDSESESEPASDYDERPKPVGCFRDDDDVDDIDDEDGNTGGGGGTDPDPAADDAPTKTTRGYCFDPTVDKEDDAHKGIGQALAYHKLVIDAMNAQEIFELGMNFPHKSGKEPTKKRQMWHAAYTTAHTKLIDYRRIYAEKRAAAKEARAGAKTTTTLPAGVVRGMDSAIRKSNVCPNQARVAMRAALAAVQALAPGASDTDVEQAASAAAVAAAEKLAEAMPKAD